jgi:uncharacterized protein (DUF924 family)
MAYSLPLFSDSEPDWVADVLRFWFEELDPRQWFASNPDVDRRIRERFEPLLQKLVAAREVVETEEAWTALAAVIVFDQFPRNIYRGNARAFAADPLALAQAKLAVGQGFDMAVPIRERLFFYLPFEHSEDRADQDLSLRLIASLGSPGLTQFASTHKAIVDRFGRFPHRNVLLGRPSTADEIASLARPERPY